MPMTCRCIHSVLCQDSSPITGLTLVLMGDTIHLPLQWSGPEIRAHNCLKPGFILQLSLCTWWTPSFSLSLTDWSRRPTPGLGPTVPIIVLLRPSLCTSLLHPTPVFRRLSQINLVGTTELPQLLPAPHIICVPRSSSLSNRSLAVKADRHCPTKSNLPQHARPTIRKQNNSAWKITGWHVHPERSL